MSGVTGSSIGALPLSETTELAQNQDRSSRARKKSQEKNLTISSGTFSSKDGDTLSLESQSHDQLLVPEQAPQASEFSPPIQPSHTGSSRQSDISNPQNYHGGLPEASTNIKFEDAMETSRRFPVEPGTAFWGSIVQQPQQIDYTIPQAPLVVGEEDDLWTKANVLAKEFVQGECEVMDGSLDSLLIFVSWLIVLTEIFDGNKLYIGWSLLGGEQWSTVDLSTPAFCRQFR